MFNDEGAKVAPLGPRRAQPLPRMDSLGHMTPLAQPTELTSKRWEERSVESRFSGPAGPLASTWVACQRGRCLAWAALSLRWVGSLQSILTRTKHLILV